MPKKRKSKAWIIWIIIALALFSFLFILPIIALFAPADFSTGNIAVIEIRGVITTDGASSFGESATSAIEVTKFIEQANSNPLVKAIVIDINSPGGSAVGSDEIAAALKSTTKPTVAYMHEIGTSGAYWIASSTDTIIANRMSITGSIGVLSSFIEFSGLMEKHGVTYQQLTAGEYKDTGSPFREPTNKELALLQKKIDRIHDFFIEEIAENRNLQESQVRKVATGEFFLGEEALELGLVDILGDKNTLETHLKEVANVTTIDYTYYQRDPTLFDILASLTSEQFFFMGKGIGKAFTEQPTSAPVIVT